MKVSIIIPTYQANEALVRAIESAINQSYENIEVIVIDDNNPDSSGRSFTENIMSKYRNNSKVIYLQHEENKNGSVARNTGIKAATGEVLSFLDDDDYYFPDRIKECIELLEENDAAYTDVVCVDGMRLMDYVYAKDSDNLLSDLMMDDNYLGTGSNLLIKRSVVEKIGYFNTELVRNQDYEYMLRFAAQGLKLKAIHKCLVVKDRGVICNIPTYETMRDIKLYISSTYQDQIERMPMYRQICIEMHKVLYWTASFNKNKEGVEKEKQILASFEYKIPIAERLKQFIKRIDFFRIFYYGYSILKSKRIKQRHEAIYGELKQINEKWISSKAN